jgi:decaprenylphospho-beta-D-ribofuranose 2-oxidase
MLVCDPGVTFQDLLREFLPQGYLVPVTPGTSFVTVGGAIANDVHGKNHDRAGSFGDHVQWIELLLANGEIVRVSPEDHPEIFAATIGGVGLTGIMLKVCFTMQRVSSNAVTVHERRIPDLDEFFSALETARRETTYSVGWIDGLARGARLGRGILITGEPSNQGLAQRSPLRLRVPIDFPNYALNAWTVRLFNEAYYRRIPAAGRFGTELYEKFFYPLDNVLAWNRIYGKRGFYQFQCVLPDSESPKGILRIMEEISNARAASFLAVLKTLGSEGRGCLSFPIRGYTLALDLPRKPETEALLARLERITLDHGGRIYLAKDACMSRAGFRTMYPGLDKFRAVLNEFDPEARFDSDMAKRLGIRKDRGRAQRTLERSRQ